MTDEQLEAEPATAAGVFGDRIDLARQYTADLARRGEELGLIGPLEFPRLWSRHILNCGILAPLLRPGSTGDVGSGSVCAKARRSIAMVPAMPPTTARREILNVIWLSSPYKLFLCD